MTASNNNSSDPTIPSLAGRVIDHDTLSNLERIAFETDGEPDILFEPVNLLAYTTAELWVFAGMLDRRGPYRHAHVVAEHASERHSATEQYRQELRRDRSQS